MTLPDLGIGADLNGAIPFSAKSEWNIRVDYAPLAKNSAKIIAGISPDKGLHADFGSGLWDGHKIGIPYYVVPADQSLVDFIETLWPDEGDDGPFPIPLDAPIEGGSDSHVIVLQQDPSAPNGLGKLYEIYQAHYNASSGAWEGQAAVFDMQGGDHQRPEGFTSADAAGLPIFPGLARYDETQHAIANGTTLGHALRFTLSQALTAMSYVGAASHFADSIDGPAPFGMHVRLRSDFEIPSDATPEVAIIINTLKQYGMILADNGSDWFISGSPDESWDNDALHVLSQVHGGDFQVVDSARLARMIVGTEAVDTLGGTKANNWMVGLGGADKIAGKGGNDVLHAGFGSDALHGSRGADKLFGEEGNDLIDGGRGHDILTGGAGKDEFLFASGDFRKDSDIIKDFSAAADTILLDHDVFDRLGGGGKLSRDAFHNGKAAGDAQDRILYDKATGSLYYDADGTGSAGPVKFAEIGNHAVLTHADFHIV